jgi:hypothetical protein
VLFIADFLFLRQLEGALIISAGPVDVSSSGGLLRGDGSRSGLEVVLGRVGVNTELLWFVVGKAGIGGNGVGVGVL